MKQVKLTIRENTRIAEGIFKMVLEGDASAVSAPGQFINIALSGHFLRRPISVCDYDAGSVTILYKIAGEGTREMSELKPETVLDVLTDLGNGFNTDKVSEGECAFLLGGGIGSAPMLALAKSLVKKNVRVNAVLGFNSAEEMILTKELAAAGAKVSVMTVDGSETADAEIDFGKGFIPDAAVLQDCKGAYYYACGPLPMLKVVYKNMKCDGELSFEERMGCGFGACMGCTMHTVHGAKRVCKDGPVFAKEELLWD